MDLIKKREMAKSNMVNLDSIKTTKNTYTQASKMGDYTNNIQAYNIFNNNGKEILGLKKKNKSISFIKKINIKQNHKYFSRVKTNIRFLFFTKRKRLSLNINQTGFCININHFIISRFFFYKKKNNINKKKLNIDLNSYNRLVFYKKKTLESVTRLYNNYIICLQILFWKKKIILFF